MKLAMLLYTGPDHHNTTSLIGLARSAREKGHDVMVFAMSAGVGNLVRPDFTSLVSEGASITVCEHNCSESQAPKDIEGIKYGSQYDLAGYVQDYDRLISFT